MEKRADYVAVFQSLSATGSGIYRRLQDKPVKSKAKRSRLPIRKC